MIVFHLSQTTSIDDGNGHFTWFKVACGLSRLTIEDAMSIVFAMFLKIRQYPNVYVDDVQIHVGGNTNEVEEKVFNNFCRVQGPGVAVAAQDVAHRERQRR